MTSTPPPSGPIAAALPIIERWTATGQPGRGMTTTVPCRKPLADMTPDELRQAAYAEYRAVYGRAPKWTNQRQRKAS